jgi:hypothetical protein
MRDTKAVVSGSNALEFLEGRRFEGSDLNVYVDHVDRMLVMGTYLMEIEGYVFCPMVDVGQPQLWDEVKDFLVVVEDGEDEDRIPASNLLEFECCSERVQVILLEEEPMLANVVGFDRTSVMNFYTADALYSLFPMLTFGCRESLVTRSKPTCVEEILRYKTRDRKYDQRGFKTVMCNRKMDERGRWKVDLIGAGAGVREHRGLDDEFTFVVGIGIDGVSDIGKGRFGIIGHFGDQGRLYIDTYGDPII